MAAARHIQQLTLWQLADELRGEVLKLTGGRAFARNLKLRMQLEDAIDSACRSITEGFGCDTHREFARFLEISRRSLNELQDSLQAAVHLRFITTAELRPCRLLMNRLFPAMSRFVAYLEATPQLRIQPRRADLGRWIDEAASPAPGRSPSRRRSEVPRPRARARGEGDRLPAAASPAGRAPADGAPAPESAGAEPPVSE